MMRVSLGIPNLSIFVMWVGRMMEVRLLQPKKAFSPMLVTLLGMVIEVRLSQPKKAQFPMLVTLLGMVIERRL